MKTNHAPTPADIARPIVEITDRLCADKLDEEYAALCRKLAGALARKRPSPLSHGEPRTWAAGIIYAVGMVNFLSDPTQRPYMTTDQLAEATGVGKSTLAAKWKVIRAKIEIGPMDPEYCRRDVMAKNPLAWLVELDGFVVDARMLPPETQDELRRRGIIPDLAAEAP